MDFEEISTRIGGLGTGDKNTALEVRTILFGMLEGLFIPGDIKEVHCTQADLQNDYTSTGLGIGRRNGWAVCNGLNGTPPKGGRTAIGWSDSYPILGSTGGSANAVVVNHSHSISTVGNVNDGRPGGEIINHTARWDRGSGTLLNGTVESVGESGIGKNMQPYIVVLFIQKL